MIVWKVCKFTVSQGQIFLAPYLIAADWSRIACKSILSLSVYVCGKMISKKWDGGHRSRVLPRIFCVAWRASHGTKSTGHCPGRIPSWTLVNYVNSKRLFYGKDGMNCLFWNRIRSKKSKWRSDAFQYKVALVWWCLNGDIYVREPENSEMETTCDNFQINCERIPTVRGKD